MPAGTPQERAAVAKDIPGDLDKELAKVNARESYDFLYTRALIARWLKEDPAACAAWLGAMNCRSGWGDPFDAFANSLPPGQLLDLMGTGWLERNRSYALQQMATVVGEKSPAELSAVLSRLSGEEAAAFRDKAMEKAKVGDAAFWLGIAGDDENRLSLLADRWIVASRPDGASSGGLWQQDAEQALAAAKGTPAEELFRRRYDAQIMEAKLAEALARVPSAPAAAADELQALYREQGLSPEEARRRMTDTLSIRYQGGLNEWTRGDWEGSLQEAVLGKIPLQDAVAARLAAIDRDLPDVFRENSRRLALKDAMAIEPSTVVELAVGRGMSEDAVRAAAELVRVPETSLAVKAAVLQSLASHDLWQDGNNLPQAKRFAQQYYSYDPKAAESWRQTLPVELATSLKEVMR